MRDEPNDRSEMVSQTLYGELFKVLEQRKKWSRIRLELDKYEGWIDNKQYLELEKIDYERLSEKQNIAFAKDPITPSTLSKKAKSPGSDSSMKLRISP